MILLFQFDAAGAAAAALRAAELAAKQTATNKAQKYDVDMDGDGVTDTEKATARQIAAAAELKVREEEKQLNTFQLQALDHSKKLEAAIKKIINAKEGENLPDDILREMTDLFGGTVTAKLISLKSLDPGLKQNFEKSLRDNPYNLNSDLHIQDSELSEVVAGATKDSQAAVKELGSLKPGEMAKGHLTDPPGGDTRIDLSELAMVSKVEQKYKLGPDGVKVYGELRQYLKDKGIDVPPEILDRMGSSVKDYENFKAGRDAKIQIVYSNDYNQDGKVNDLNMKRKVMNALIEFFHGKGITDENLGFPTGTKLKEFDQIQQKQLEQLQLFNKQQPPSPYG